VLRSLSPIERITITEDELGFRLSSLGEQLYILCAEAPDFTKPTGYSDGVVYPAIDNGRAHVRRNNSIGVAVWVRAEWSPDANDAGRLLSPAAIGSIMYRPPSQFNGVENFTLEYIEVRNDQDTDLPMWDEGFRGIAYYNTWRIIADDPLGPVYIFPRNITLRAKSSLLVVSVEPSVFRAESGFTDESVQVLGPWTGAALRNDRLHVQLLFPDQQNADYTVPYVVADELEYSAEYPVATADAGDGRSTAGAHQCERHWQRAEELALRHRGRSGVHDSLRRNRPTMRRPGTRQGSARQWLWLVFYCACLLWLGVKWRDSVCAKRARDCVAAREPARAADACARAGTDRNESRGCIGSEQIAICRERSAVNCASRALCVAVADGGDCVSSVASRFGRAEFALVVTRALCAVSTRVARRVTRCADVLHVASRRIGKGQDSRCDGTSRLSTALLSCRRRLARRRTQRGAGRVRHRHARHVVRTVVDASRNANQLSAVDGARS
jgi:hypothetical protein